MGIGSHRFCLPLVTRAACVVTGLLFVVERSGLPDAPWPSRAKADVFGERCGFIVTKLVIVTVASDWPEYAA